MLPSGNNESFTWDREWGFMDICNPKINATSQYIYLRLSHSLYWLFLKCIGCSVKGEQAWIMVESVTAFMYIHLFFFFNKHVNSWSTITTQRWCSNISKVTVPGDQQTSCKILEMLYYPWFFISSSLKWRFNALFKLSFLRTKWNKVLKCLPHATSQPFG